MSREMTRWRAQILPAGGPFSAEFMNDLVKAHAASVFDWVPFLISDVHTADPDLTSGYVQELEIVEDGLDVILTAHSDAAEILRRDRVLRAAPQVISSYVHPCGLEWPHVVRHVLATHHPLLQGLRGFEEVS